MTGGTPVRDESTTPGISTVGNIVTVDTAKTEAVNQDIATFLAADILTELSLTSLSDGMAEREPTLVVADDVGTTNADVVVEVESNEANDKARTEAVAEDNLIVQSNPCLK
jgi:hypothetical protein